MQKTFCDRCNGECDGFHLDLHAHGYSTTSDGVIAEELYPSKRPPQLCTGCVTWLAGEGIDFELISGAAMEQRKGEDPRVMRNPDLGESEVPLRDWDSVEARVHP